MALILPEEARETPSVWAWLEAMVAGNGPIRRLCRVDVRQSMANGGGPACLRLRVVADPRRSIRASWSTRRSSTGSPMHRGHWPEQIAPADLADPAAVGTGSSGRRALYGLLDVGELADREMLHA